MPIIIGDNDEVEVVDLNGKAKASAAISNMYSPKFFHKTILTGKGGQSRGLLNEKWDPKMHPSGYTLAPNPDMEMSTQYNKDIKIYNIPCYMISPGLWANTGCIHSIPRPDMSEMEKIATNGKDTVYIMAPLHAIQIQEQQLINAPGASATHPEKILTPLMNVFVFIVRDAGNPEHINGGGLQMMQSPYMNTKENMFYQDIVSNLVRCLLDIYNKLTAEKFTVDKQAMDDFLQNYSLYTELCKSAERWLTRTDHYINDILIKNVNIATKGQISTSTAPILNDWWTSGKDSVMEMLSRLEKYNIPLDQYKIIYDNMTKNLSPQIVATICKANLNLRLSNTLQHMDQNRAQNASVPCTTHVKSKIPFSIEQMAAIESTSPFTLVQSGAGTGKSTVIRGRIDHMLANGIDAKDITVLSFTNAAANHIKDLQPQVHSMTIAAMLHTIYSNNYPTHQLSSLSTILNSLEIYFGVKNHTITAAQRQFVDDFRRVLERLRDNNDFTKANNFVEENIDETINVLDVIQQTSLELESIICYQKMDTLVEPDETKTKHLIIDEVQDNSIAEFIYSIKYTDKHQCSMYIVGDCSQTLFEFRASNPKALNVLESSGVFETHKLQTNYRSNQEILDFANILLGNIEANQYANIQLHANSLAPVTEKSFKDAVTLHYERIQNKSASTFDNMIAHSIAIDTKKWVDDKFAKGEQVAILAPKRFTLNKIEEYLRKIYNMPKPVTQGAQDDIVSLVPIHPKDMAIFSKFIARYWDDITYAPPMNILTTIRRELSDKFDYLVPYKSAATLQKARDDVFGKLSYSKGLYGDFEAAYTSRVINWQNQVAMSVMTTAQMLDEVKKLMIDFEIKRNAIMKSVISARNAEEKTAQAVDNAKFILSTIHSAKGLEFDNVIVFYESESASSIEEATKRMYYVAFTRAKKAEYIFAYDTMAFPKICGDYDAIVNNLAKQNNASIVANTVNSGADPDSNDAQPADTDTTANTDMADNDSKNADPVAEENMTGVDETEPTDENGMADIHANAIPPGTFGKLPGMAIDA